MSRNPTPGADRDLSRRDFLAGATKLGFGALLTGAAAAWGLDAVLVDNPLERYPDRDWEKVYRDLFRSDSSFVFLCAPNDTHNCLLRAEVRNGVVTRIGPTYGYGKAADLYGNGASHRWDPRCCQKGLALTRRIYGDRRVRGPMVRRGFRAWVEAGFPRDPQTGRPPAENFRRAEDGWEQVTWEVAADVVARTLENVARTYTGEEGAARLRAQGVDEAMIEAMHGAGTQALKFRGGMPLLGTRVFAFSRLAGSLALLDAKIRGVPPDEALGARHWDSYSWHTDLPPGHPMVTGQQTGEFDLSAVEHSKLVLVWGMNWICTKMPDSHWLTEARLQGTKVVVIACEVSSTSCKGDESLVVRPGTTPALALGLCHVILRDGLVDESFVRRYTDLPLLVRTDTGTLLRAADCVPGWQPGPLVNGTTVLEPGQAAPPPFKQRGQLVTAEQRAAWGDFVIWNRTTGGPAPLTRDQVGDRFDAAGLDPALEGTFTVPLVAGGTVEARPVYDLIKAYVMESFPPEATEALTWAPAGAVESLARDIAAARGSTLFAMGMGPNQFFNNDLKDRTVFLLAALTGNVGRIGGNVGSYAGNYRTALFNGLGQFIAENPFDVELDPAKPARTAKYTKYESLHYFNYGDRPLRVGNKLLTGRTHMPCPTRTAWVANSNSAIGNAKWHYDLVHNTLPQVEMLVVQDWWWTTSCEWADVVFGVDSWAEFKTPDFTASVTNPFLQVFPATPLPRLYDTRGDLEVLALVGRRLGELIGDTRLADVWRFATPEDVPVYLQRVLDASTSARGYRFADLHAKAQEGIPALMMSRTTPRATGWEQTEESTPWYGRSGRLEFYRDEPEFLAAGENLPVHREPVDATPHEPNVILADAAAFLRPEEPAACGFDPADLGTETRQARNVRRTWRQIVASAHPLAAQGYRFLFHTPKYRHGAHTTPVDTDMTAVLFGPFGDLYRHDKRMPFVTEGYLDIHPADARELGVEDGDYVWVDSDPSDRPYRNFKSGDPFYKVARLLCRARYYPGTPRGVTRMWHNMYGATPGSQRGAAERPDGLAKNPETNYQAMFRSGSHQSGTRAWLKPTLMTDTLVRKEGMGQVVGQGFLADVHCPTGAPREAVARVERAEAGGLDGKGLWRPAALGFRPGYETPAFRRFLDGGWIDGGEED
ncbi:MAG: molybdopterin-dependent oxidoreductase [Deltaproteobacteria bacterium]|nr:molybdopterin-dependent oxidoreductase [Deltaproteobacteria bacterium]